MRNSKRCAFAVAAATLSVFVTGQAHATAELKPVINAISPNPAEAGKNVQIRTFLSNQGASAADLNQKRANGTAIHMLQWVFKENGNGPDRLIFAMSMMGTLNAGQQKTYTPSAKIPSNVKPGRHAICAIADPENRIPEVRENNNRSCFVVRVKAPVVVGKLPRGTMKPGGPARVDPGRARMALRPDLVVRNLKVSPLTVAPGGTLNVSATIHNQGNATARGNLTTPTGNGFVVDASMGRDSNPPAGYAQFKPNYSEDVLLRGGRFSNTSDLPAGASRAYGYSRAQIPADTPPGAYFVCAVVDPGKKIAESNETNNSRCRRIKVRGRRR